MSPQESTHREVAAFVHQADRRLHQPESRPDPEAGPKGIGASLETYQVGAHFEALDEGVLLVPLDPRYTQVGFNLVSVQVCDIFEI